MYMLIQVVYLEGRVDGLDSNWPYGGGRRLFDDGVGQR